MEAKAIIIDGYHNHLPTIGSYIIMLNQEEPHRGRLISSWLNIHNMDIKTIAYTYYTYQERINQIFVSFYALLYVYNYFVLFENKCRDLLR